MQNIPREQDESWENTPLPQTRGAIVDQILSLDAEKNIIKMKWDIRYIHTLISKRIDSLNELSNGIKEISAEQLILDRFLDALEIEKTEENRYIAYDRISKLREDSLLNYIRKAGFCHEKTMNTLTKAFSFVQDFHDELHGLLIKTIETEKLLTPFYRTLIIWVHTVWKEFHTFHKSWNEKLIYGINKKLKDRFGSQENILLYLEENNLFDTWHGWEKADRSYSILEEDGDGYKKLAYKDAFPLEINKIIGKLEELKNNLETEQDEVYKKKDKYLAYLESLISAFSEKNTDQLVTQWSKVDEAWMEIRTPFQIVHPLEKYEDVYRWAVAPEWDFRLQNTELFESVVQRDMTNMFENFLREKNIKSDSDVAIFSIQGLWKVQLYISNPLTYYGARLNWLPSAQVIPNDKEVTKVHGKKIFGFPEKALAHYRSQPTMVLSKKTLSDQIRTKKKKILSDEKKFYKLYDIETIGHEFWHTLWIEGDTEIVMNQSWNFKNIEEWKATTGWLMAFFQNPLEELKEDIIVGLVTRSVRLIDWMKQTEVVPYYTEWLIHLKILFDSGIIFLDDENKVEMDYTDEKYQILKNLYTQHYGDLIENYVAKKDASEFLSQYTISENWYFLPKDEKLKAFVKNYYELYEKIGNMVDTEE